MIKLPEPKYVGMPFEDAIKKRRSVRNYLQKALNIDQLSQLLFAAQGITGKLFGQPLRSAPSAGALYPIEIYLIVNNVTDLPPGIYHYIVIEHALKLVKSGDFSGEITSAGLHQKMLGKANVVFALSAVFDRTRSKYGELSSRYV